MNIFDLLTHKVNVNILTKFKQYKKRCEKKGLKFTLKLRQFEYEIQKPCYICKTPNSNGLDRVNNLEGYTTDNIYPCCFDCNRMKSNKTTIEFTNYLSKLNPNHELLKGFNKINNYQQYNKKINKIQKFIATQMIFE